MAMAGAGQYLLGIDFDLDLDLWVQINVCHNMLLKATALLEPAVSVTPCQDTMVQDVSVDDALLAHGLSIDEIADKR